MPIAQALYTGVTGISVNSDSMSIIANNIANANSTGFKRDRAEFEDMITENLNGGAQIGRGSRLANVKTMHSQGGMKVTDNITDIAIQGSGFFVISSPEAEQDVSAGRLYSRVGNLHFDKDGYFATPSGGRVQGYAADSDGKLSSRMSDIRIETNSIPPRPTDKILLNVQLDSRVETLTEPFNPLKPEATSHFNTAVTVFDSHGRGHSAVVYFRKLDSSMDGISWEWKALVNGSEVIDPEEGELKQFAEGVVKFDKHGFLAEENQGLSEVNFSNGAFPKQKIDFDFGRNLMTEKGNGTNASSSIAGKSITNFHQQNGYEAGQIKSMGIGLDGLVTGIFTNGIQRVLGGIALATFSNEAALVKTGKNLFSNSIHSGPANIGLPKTGTRGSLVSSSLEESNVDIASEFIDMITTQRLFQANSRSITTADNLIEEIINLKR